MENTNLNLARVRDTFDTTRDWLVTRRRVLQLNTIVLLVIIGVFLVIMSAGSLVQAFVAAHQPFSLHAPISSVIAAAAPIIPIVGFISLLIFSYLTNLTQLDDHRRELAVDGIVLAIAFLVPQIIYHIGWLATTFFIVTSRTYILTTEMFVNVNIEWLLSVGMIVVVGVLGWLLRYILLAPTVIEADDYADYVEADNYQRRVYE